MKYFKPSTIKNKLFLTSILQTSIPILLVGIISSIIMLSILRFQTFNNTNSFFSDVSSAINDFSTRIFDISQALLYDEDMINIIAFDDDSQSYDTEHLSDVLINNPDIQAVRLIIGDAEYSATNEKNSIYQYASVGYNNIKRALDESSENSIWYVSYQNDNASDIFFARQLKNPYTNEARGMLFFQISSRTFSRLLSFPDKSQNGQFCLLASNKLPIVRNFDLPPDAMSEIYSAENGVSTVSGKYYFYNTLSDLGWKIVYRVDKRGLYHILYLLMTLIILLCVISLMITVLFTQHINKTVVAPIQKLSGAMRSWTESNVFKKERAYEISEIDMLYDDFRNMTQKVTDLISINYKANLVQKESELKMLQSQINPHFIFNTLEAINSYAIIYDAQEISDIAVAFSELIEQSIGYDTGTVHTFERELHLTECYLTIIQIRFGDKISVIKDIEDDVLQTPMPNLIIQPIVENSVNHGIIPSGRRCELKIEAHIIGSDLIVHIVDNGTGIQKDKLDELNKSLASGKNSAQKSIGLLNVNKRLKLLYGDEYQLEISSEENKFTRVTLKIKIRK